MSDNRHSVICLSDCLRCQPGVGVRLGASDPVEECPQEPVFVYAPVEAKYELVEIALHVLLTHPVKRPLDRQSELTLRKAISELEARYQP